MHKGKESIYIKLATDLCLTWFIMRHDSKKIKALLNTEEDKENITPIQIYISSTKLGNIPQIWDLGGNPDCALHILKQIMIR